MNFSSVCPSPWSASTVFSAPNLISHPKSKHLGPLLFSPAAPPRLLLLSSPSLAYRPPPAPDSGASLVDGLRVFFRGASDPAAFLSSADVDALAGDVLASEPRSDPLNSNLLAAVPSCRDPSNLLLFFPSGANGHFLAFISISIDSPSVPEVFEQQDGFRHPCHRITRIVASRPPPLDWGEVDPGADDPLVEEGFLMVTTMYAVNWFRVETRVSDSGKCRPFLVPCAMQGFENYVVDACWNPHFFHESALLLESGQLCWFDLTSMCGGTVEVKLESENLGGWLGCEYGGQPWVLMVACSSAVLLVDLRAQKSTADAKVLARIEMPHMYGFIPLLEGNSFLAFSKASYNDFYFSVVTEKHLLLFDTRQPLSPILTWDHGLDCPSMITMYRLSELRPSVEFKWASDAGFAILVGSLWNDEFILFCYGPRDVENDDNYTFFAWELPSHFPLSGKSFRSGDAIVKEEFLMNQLPYSIDHLRNKHLLVGFYIIPHELSKSSSECTAEGFTLIRFMLSGSLEMQRFLASSDPCSVKVSGTNNELKEFKDWPVCFVEQEERLSTRCEFLQFDHLYDYINGNMYNKLDLCCRQLNHKNVDRQNIHSKMREFLQGNQISAAFPTSKFISDTSVPMNVFEIASRKILTELRIGLLQLAFTKSSELDADDRGSHFEFLNFPSCLPHHCLPPFLVSSPSRRSGRCSKKTLHGEALVGPVLPVPFLLAVQDLYEERNSSIARKYELDHDILSLQCNAVLSSLFPEISIAETINSFTISPSQEIQDDRPFFVYMPTFVSTISASRRTFSNSKSEEPQNFHMEDPASEFKNACKDEKYTTFVCGIAENACDRSKCKFTEPELCNFFDLSPVKLDFDSSTTFHPEEVKIYRELNLKQQFYNWQDSYKPYKDFCAAYKIPYKSGDI